MRSAVPRNAFRTIGKPFVQQGRATSLCARLVHFLGNGCALGNISCALATAISKLDGWRRGGLGDSAFAVRTYRSLAGVSFNRIFRRRSASGCAGNVDARAQRCVGVLQASATDGMGSAGLDLDISSQEL